jgi:hypothetical protein
MKHNSQHESAPLPFITSEALWTQMRASVAEKLEAAFRQQPLPSSFDYALKRYFGR